MVESGGYCLDGKEVTVASESLARYFFVKNISKSFIFRYVLAITCVSRALRYLPDGVAKGPVSRNETDPLSSQNGPFRNAV